VSLLNDEPDACYLAEVFVDGKRAQHFVLDGPRDTKTFVGFAQSIGHRGGEKSICFSMPQPVFEVAGRSNMEPEQDEEKLIEIGSVRIDLHETFFTKNEVRIERKQGGGVDFEPTDKKTAQSLGDCCCACWCHNPSPCLPNSQPAYFCIHFVPHTQETSLSRAMAHQIFGSEQLHRVVENLLAQAPASGDSCDSSDLSRLAQVLPANILIWPGLTATNPSWSNLESPSLVPSAIVLGCQKGVPSHCRGAGAVLCMRTYMHACVHSCMRTHTCTRAFQCTQSAGLCGRYCCMMTEEGARNEEETKAANKAKRRKGRA
jgi:hypothetical protein